MIREKVILEKEKETLLIPLYSRAQESGKANPILFDPKAGEIIKQIDYDFTRLKVPAKTQIMLCLRAKQLDHYVEAFLDRHPNGAVVNLGCGLDSRFDRVDNGAVNWYDLDFPEVVGLRRKFYRESDRYHLLSSSVTDPRWMEALGGNQGEHLFVADGLLMYLTEAEVKDLFRRLADGFPGCRIACDVFSSFTVKNINRHPSIRTTGADIHWGIDDARQIQDWSQDFRVVEEWFFSQSEALGKLSLGFRLGFKLAGLFPIANQAHRILLLQL